MAVTRAKHELVFMRPLSTVIKGKEMPSPASQFEPLLRPFLSTMQMGYDPFRSTDLKLDEFLLSFR